MIPLTNEETEEVIDLAYTTAENYILKKINKKDFENIEITINLINHEDSFDIDIDIDLDTDLKLPDDFASCAIEESLNAVDAYIENRNKNL